MSCGCQRAEGGVLKARRGHDPAAMTWAVRAIALRFAVTPQVADMWPEIGESGFVIWRYHMRRLPDQATPPWEIEGWRKSEAKKVGGG